MMMVMATMMMVVIMMCSVLSLTHDWHWHLFKSAICTGISALSLSQSLLRWQLDKFKEQIMKRAINRMQKMQLAGCFDQWADNVAAAIDARQPAAEAKPDGDAEPAPGPEPEPEPGVEPGVEAEAAAVAESDMEPAAGPEPSLESADPAEVLAGGVSKPLVPG